MTLQELRALRAQGQKAMDRRVGGDRSIEITVAMGTCGIAAGAKEALNAFADELVAKNVRNVVLKQTDCMGFCHAEPTVEVKVPGMADVLYGKVDPETARKIVQTHVVGKNLVANHVFDRASRDIVKEK